MYIHVDLYIHVHVALRPKGFRRISSGRYKISPSYTYCTSLGTVYMYTAHLLWDGPDVGEAFTEDDKHPTGPTAEGRGRTIKSRVTSTKDYHVAMEIREGALAGTHTCTERER